MSEKMTIVKALMRATSEKDYETFLSYLSDDIEYHYHVGSRPLLGKEWVSKFLDKYETICGDSEWRIDRHAETDDYIMVEGYEEYTDLRTGDRVAHPYMGIIEFEDGKVKKWRDYFEMDNKKSEAA